MVDCVLPPATRVKVKAVPTHIVLNLRERLEFCKSADECGHVLKRFVEQGRGFTRVCDCELILNAVSVDQAPGVIDLYCEHSGRNRVEEERVGMVRQDCAWFQQDCLEENVREHNKVGPVGRECLRRAHDNCVRTEVIHHVRNRHAEIQSRIRVSKSHAGIREGQWSSELGDTRIDDSHCEAEVDNDRSWVPRLVPPVLDSD